MSAGVLEKLNAWEKELKKECVEFSGYIPIGPPLFSARINYLLDRQQIKQGQRFFELGHGLGMNLVIAANAGLETYGAEINQALWERSLRMVALAREKSYIPPDVICFPLNGSYYTKAYVRLRADEKSQVISLEEEIWDPLGLGEIHIQKDSTDVYASVGIPFDSIDIFYGYFYTRQVPSVLEMFSMYARKDAILLCDYPSQLPKYKKRLERLGLKKEEIYTDVDSLMCKPCEIITKQCRPRIFAGLRSKWQRTMCMAGK